jgi:hypothetical protein
MNTWNAFLDSLDRPGGHYVILFWAMISFGFLAALHVPRADTAFDMAGGALLYAMKGAATNVKGQE